MNDYFNNFSGAAPKSKGRNGQRTGTGRSSTLISLQSEVDDLSSQRNELIKKIGSVVATFGVNSASGNIDAHNTGVVRSNLDALLKSARLSVEEENEVLRQAIVGIIMNA